MRGAIRGKRGLLLSAAMGTGLLVAASCLVGPGAGPDSGGGHAERLFDLPR